MQTKSHILHFAFCEIIYSENQIILFQIILFQINHIIKFFNQCTNQFINTEILAQKFCLYRKLSLFLQKFSLYKKN